MPQVREYVASSQSHSVTPESLSPSPPKPGRQISSIQGGAETFPSCQGYIVHLQSAQEILKLSTTAPSMMKTSQCYQ